MTTYIEAFEARQTEARRLIREELLDAFRSPPDNGTLTSREAAVKIVPDAARQRDEVFRAIQDSDAGLTREQIQDHTGFSGDSVRPRVWELMEAGMIQEREGVYRFTRSGRRAAVLEVV